MRAVEVDPRDDGAYAAWFAVLDAALEHERPGEPHWSAAEQRVPALDLLRPGGDRTGVLLGVEEDGRTVGAGRLVLHVHDNTHLAQVLVFVLPDARRRGVGTALLDELARRAGAAGRRVLTGEVDEPAPGAPGAAFARHVGAVEALRDVRRDLPLPPDLEAWDALERAARPYAGGYRLLTWRDRTPPEWLEQRAALSAAMSVEVPLGDLPYEAEVWDAPRLTAYEDGILAQGRTWFTAAAETGSRLVAFTDIGVPLGAPERAYQWSTLVLPEHRGHRLGTLVKLACLREVLAQVPRCRLVTTWNADVNVPMIAVNEALGFRTAGALVSWRLDL